MKQEVLTGEDSFMKVPDLLAAKGVSSIFVITGSHFEKDYSHLQTRALWTTLEHTFFIKKGINVTVEEIELAYDVYHGKKVDAILAIGGGSVLDLAKGIIYRNLQNKYRYRPLFIAVPTTAGSGSEATSIAVVYANKAKESLDDQLLMPDVAVLDPCLSVSLPARQTAISGIDAFAQGIESYWSIHATDISRSFAKEAIIALIKYLPQAVHAPTLEIREKVLSAAHLAGKAINMTRTTGPHALSYFLSAHYDIPHGQAVALFLPVFFLYNSHVDDSNCSHPGGTESVRQSLQELNSILGVRTGEEAAEFTRRFISGLGLATNFKSLDLEKTAIVGDLLNAVNQQRFRNNPASFSREGLLRLFGLYL
jgi:alcohol dehydrogenase class IV